MRTVLATAFYLVALATLLAAIGYVIDDFANWRIGVFIPNYNVVIWQDVIILLCIATLSLYCFLRGANL